MRMHQIPKPLQTLLASAHLRQVPKGQIIIYEGDTPHEIYVIKSGIVKIYDIDSQGNEKILHILHETALLPLVFFSGKNQPVNWFYAAITDCELYALPQQMLEEAMRADGAFAVHLMHDFSIDVHELLVRLSSLEKTTVRDKLIAALKFLLVYHTEKQRSNWWQVRFPVSHQLLADLSGITRESAAIAMKELQDEKIVRSPRLTVLDINRPALIKAKKSTDIDSAR